MLMVDDAADIDCGGAPCGPAQLVFGYDPANDSWHKHAVVLHGDKVGGMLVPYSEGVARVDPRQLSYWTVVGIDSSGIQSFDRKGTCVTGGAAVAHAPATDEIIVWGGAYITDGPTEVRCAQGVAFHGTTVRTLAPAPATFRGGHASALWVEDALYVFSWEDARLAKYDPKTDHWTDVGAMPPGTSNRDAPLGFGRVGNRLAFYGGQAFDGDESSFVALDGARFDLTYSSWMPLLAEPKTAAGDRWRDAPATWVQPGPSGMGELVLYGGYGYEYGDLLSEMVAVDFQSGSWRTIDSSGGLGARSGAAAVWDGCEAIVYGGMAGTAPLFDGAIYKP